MRGQVAILAGYFTTAGLGDLADLQWALVDLKRGALVFTQSQAGSEIEISLHFEHKRWLSDRAASMQPKTVAVFPSLRGDGTRVRNGLSGQFAAITKKPRV